MKSASAQKKKLADMALLLDESSYVDDIGESKDSREAIDDLASDADKILGDLSVVVKAWSKTGVKPAANVSDAPSGETGQKHRVVPFNWS